MLTVPSKAGETEKTRIMLGLLESVGRGGNQSQRRLASELGVALGLVNAYLKRCVKKGLVKVGEVPTRRYGYYLTPHGFAEKSRLTVEYLSYSFDLFRRAKIDCASVLEAERAKGASRIAIVGTSDFAEIAAICALNIGMVIVAFVDQEKKSETFLGAPLVGSLEDIAETIDVLVVADIRNAPETIKAAEAKFGASRVLVPGLILDTGNYGSAA